MRLRHAIMGMGAVFAVCGGAAHADDAKTLAHALKTPTESTPWFERFTASAGDASRLAPSDRTVTWAPSARWGLTLNVRDADRTKTAARDEAAIGAFYDFTPRLRIGGELRVSDPAGVAAAGAPAGSSNLDERAAGVKLESAFRF
ncbi:MAG: NtrZ family periplasmic regulatory protein [Hyphomonadaceae bacterium]